MRFTNLDFYVVKIKFMDYYGYQLYHMNQISNKYYIVIFISKSIIIYIYQFYDI